MKVFSSFNKVSRMDEFVVLIDKLSLQFSNRIKQKFNRLQLFSLCELSWLMLEHYQFSLRNPQFLFTATQSTRLLYEKGVSLELLRNFNEEKDHPSLYQVALIEMGINVDDHKEFKPTTAFFDEIQSLLQKCPSYVLGSIYVIETAAIFEHELFTDVAQYFLKKNNLKWDGSKIKYFHELHLSGVEQSHKEGLGEFVKKAIDRRHDCNSDDEINKECVLQGARQVLHIMDNWWGSLLRKMLPRDITL